MTGLKTFCKDLKAMTSITGQDLGDGVKIWTRSGPYEDPQLMVEKDGKELARASFGSNEAAREYQKTVLKLFSGEKTK